MWRVKFRYIPPIRWMGINRDAHNERRKEGIFPMMKLLSAAGFAVALGLAGLSTSAFACGGNNCPSYGGGNEVRGTGYAKQVARGFGSGDHVQSYGRTEGGLYAMAELAEGSFGNFRGRFLGFSGLAESGTLATSKGPGHAGAHAESEQFIDFHLK